MREPSLHSRLWLLPLIVLVMSPARPAAGQSGDATATSFWGFGPTLTISDAGLDTNILATSKNAKRDQTGNVKVQVTPTVHIGKVMLSAGVSARQTYFRRYAYERSLDSDDSIRVDLPMRRLALHAAGAYLRTRDPYDPQLFIRTLRTEHSVEGGGDLRVTGKTHVIVGVRTGTVDFDASDSEFHSALRDALNRSTQSLTLSLRTAITPLTTIDVTAAAQRDRFEVTRTRDSDGRRFSAGLQLRAGGLVDGEARLGYRMLHARADGSDLGGWIGSLDVGHTFAGFIRCATQAEHALTQSFRLSEPFLASSRVGGSVTARLGGMFEITTAASREWRNPITFLHDTSIDGDIASQAGDLTLDTLHRYTAGIALRNRSDRFGVTADYLRFDPKTGGRRYDRLRIVSSVTHRF